MSTKAKSVESNLQRAASSAADAAEDTSSIISGEFKNFVSDIEALIKSSTSLDGDELDKVKAQIGERIVQAKEALGEAKDTIVSRAKKTVTATDDYVHDQPWTAIGAGAALGLFVGFLLARRG